MPELPEVETVARQLDPLLRSRRVKCLRVLDPKLQPGRCPALRSRRVESVTRVGKQVVLELSEAGGRRSPAWLVVHLRMTGRLVWFPDSLTQVDRHCRARLELEGGTLAFIDTRRFGTMRWHQRPQSFSASGVDPTSKELSVSVLGRLLSGSHQELKVWLLRQDRLVGLGNIYASEIPFRAGLSPFREAGSLDERELRRLHRSILRVLRDAIRNCGTTFSDFQDARGELGSYQNLLGVYGLEGEHCAACGSTIVRAVQQQRSTYFCPSCQGVSASSYKRVQQEHP